MSTAPSRVLAELLLEHEALREMIDRCEQLSDDLDAGRAEPAALTSEVARLRVAFKVHNRHEEQFLRPLLIDSGAFAEVRIEQMVTDHFEEHRLVHKTLADGVTAELRLALQRLREHLSTEERYFLSSKVLRDDVIVVEGGG